MEDRSLDMLQEMREDIGEIKEDLRIHIYRTELAEEGIKMLRSDLKPVEDHVKFVQKLIKLVLISTGACASIATVGTLIYTIMK